MSEPISEEMKAAFLEHLRGSANVSASAEAVGVGRSTVYSLKETDKEFRKAWKKAEKLGTKALADEATRRGREGTLRPVFYKGVECGEVREYSDTLLIFMLKARDPKKFKDKIEHSGPNGQPMVVYVQGVNQEKL